MKQTIEKASKDPDLIPAKQSINTYEWKPKVCRNSNPRPHDF